jgi:hypothetical protein
MAGMELLDRFRQGWREPIEVMEHEPPSERVSPVDLVRIDTLGRKVIVCPAGQAPHSQLVLTDQERKSLIDPPKPPPDGTLEPGHCGFTPRNTVVGRYLIEE